MDSSEVKKIEPAENSKPILLLPPAESPSVKMPNPFSAVITWLAGNQKSRTPATPRATEHKGWLSFYWAFSKELGRECYRTWRGEVLFSVVLLGFMYLITRNPVDLPTILWGTSYSLSVFALWHAIRIPWKLYSESHGLHWGWGVLGICVAIGMIALAGWTAAWFYTMQPRITLDLTPTVENSRNVQLEAKLKDLAPFQEPKDSLRRRTIKLVNDLNLFWIQQPAPQMPIQNPATDEDRKRNATWDLYWQKLKVAYMNRDFNEQILGIVREYKAKGIPTGFLEQQAEQQDRLIGALPFGGYSLDTCDKYANELCQLKELAFHVNAQDRRIDPPDF
jgi:hypothetical protein